MSKETVVCPNVVHAVLNCVHDAKDELTWAVVGYSDVRTLTVLASGTGGLGAAKQHMPDDRESFALIAYTHKIEVATTRKYAYVAYVPETLNPMRKSLLTTHKPQIKKFLKPHHVDLEVTERSELDEGEILRKIGFASGTAIYEISEEKASQIRAKENFVKSNQYMGGAARSTASWAQKKPQKQQSFGSGAGAGGGGDSNFTVSAEVQQEMANLRNDDHPTTWLVTGYENDEGSHAVLLASGNSQDRAVDELSSALDPRRTQYSLFRVLEVVDLRTSNVKFGFVKYLPGSTKPRRRGIVGSHSGAVERAFANFHVDFSINENTQISQAIAMEKIQSLSGSKSAVTNKVESKLKRSEQKWKPVADRLPKVAKRATAQGLSFVDEPGFRQAVAAVHSDVDSTNWCLGSYENKSIVMIGAGQGNVSELLNHLNGSINFGILRVTEQIDKSTTTKFVFFYFQPKDVTPMVRARAGTIRSDIAAVFQPWHVDFFVEDPAEITQAVVEDKVGAASGTKSNVTSRAHTANKFAAK